MFHGSDIAGIVSGLFEAVVALYALRLNRVFGSKRAGWSLFSAFSLLALLHLSRFTSPYLSGIVEQIIYAVISVLILAGLVHVGSFA